MTSHACAHCSGGQEDAPKCPHIAPPTALPLASLLQCAPQHTRMCVPLHYSHAQPPTYVVRLQSINTSSKCPILSLRLPNSSICMKISHDPALLLIIQAYSQAGRGQTPPFTNRAASSCDPAQSGGSGGFRGAGVFSHPPTAPSAISTAERPDMSSNSHLASHPASISHPSHPSQPGETPTEESVTATPTSQHTAPADFTSTNSYGAHTTLPQFFQPSAFSVADDPVWAHTSWQEHENNALHAGGSSLPPLPPGCASENSFCLQGRHAFSWQECNRAATL